MVLPAGRQTQFIYSDRCSPLRLLSWSERYSFLKRVYPNNFIIDHGADQSYLGNAVLSNMDGAHNNLVTLTVDDPPAERGKVRIFSLESDYRVLKTPDSIFQFIYLPSAAFGFFDVSGKIR